MNSNLFAMEMGKQGDKTVATSDRRRIDLVLRRASIIV